MTTTWTTVEERIVWTATEDPSYQFVTLRPTSVTLTGGGGGGIELGETSSTAYRGDRGKTAYDHSQATGNPHGAAVADITGLTSALDDKAATSHSHSGSDITSGTVAFARLPTGTGSTQVAVGDHTHTAAAVGAVPTSRTLAGLDLSADRSADALLAALHAATAKPIVKGAAGYGTPWVPGTTGVGAIATTKGDLFLARGTPLRGTIDYVVAFPATAGTSGDTVWIVAYACGSNGLPTGTPLISQQVTTGTTSTVIEQAVTAVDAPSAPVWVGVLFTGSNGSNINWQGVAAQVDPGVMRWASGTLTAIKATSQGNTPPDVTGYSVSSSPGSTTWGVYVVNAALVGVR